MVALPLVFRVIRGTPGVPPRPQPAPRPWCSFESFVVETVNPRRSLHPEFIPVANNNI